MISPVRITVEKRLSIPDLIEKYGIRIDPLCPLFEVGQEFTARNLDIPEGFCAWAWADIQRDVAIMALGGDLKWIKGEGIMITCCTDGFRPVIFRLERLAESEN